MSGCRATRHRAVEWMDIAAMKSGRKPRDQSQIDAIYAKRLNAASR